VVIDIEWGAFGDNGSLDFIRTLYEKEVDVHSNHVGSFTYVFQFYAKHIIFRQRYYMASLIPYTWRAKTIATPHQTALMFRSKK